MMHMAIVCYEFDVLRRDFDNQSINQTNYFIVRLKVDQRAGQLSLPHLGITKKNRTKTDEQINPVNSLEP